MNVRGTIDLGNGSKIDTNDESNYRLTIGQIVKILSIRPGSKLSWVTLGNGNGWVLHSQARSNNPRTNYVSLMDLRFAATEFDDEVALVALDINGENGTPLIINMLLGMSKKAAQDNIH
jgi:hypothetical protein